MELSLKLRNNTWQVHGTVIRPDGSKFRVRKSTGYTKPQKNLANAAMLQIIADVASGKLGGDEPTGEADTIADAYKLYINRPNPPGQTDVQTLARFCQRFGGVKLTEVRSAEIMMYVQGRGNKAGTVAREINSIKAMFKYATDLGLNMAPVNLVKPSVDDERTRWLTEDERDRLIATVHPDVRGLVTFLFFTGARLGEAFDTKWQDVLDGKVFFRTKKGKAKRTRVRAVPLVEDVAAVMGARGNSNEYVFTNPSGAKWERTAFYNYFNPACESAGILDFTPHDCRHTFASHLVQGGASLRAVADLLGHSSLAMVMRYSHLAPSHLEDTMKLLGRRGTNVAQPNV